MGFRIERRLGTHGKGPGLQYYIRIWEPDAPSTPELTLSNNSVSESVSIGSVVGALSVINGVGTYTFTKTADPDNKFSISAGNLVTSAALDYETAQAHSVTVQATNGTDTVSSAFSITVTNVIEGTLGPTTATYDVADVTGKVIATITGLDAGASETVSSISPNDGRLSLSGNQILKGGSVSSAGNIAAVVTTSAGRTLNISITVTAAPAFAWANIGALFSGGAVDGIMIDLTDKTTLFQDASGLSPVVNNADPVGLALDQHKWGGLTLAAYRAAQPELLPDGDNSANWALGGSASLSNVSGLFRVTATTSTLPTARRAIGVTVGRTYEVTFRNVTQVGGTISNTLFRLGKSANGSEYYSIQPATSSVVSRIFVKATATTLHLGIQGASGNGNYTEWADFSIKEIDGHHINMSGSNRPTWDSTEGATRFTATSTQRLISDYYNAANNNFLAAWAKPASTASGGILGVTDASPSPTRYAALQTSTGKAKALLGSTPNLSFAGAPANTDVSMVATENGTTQSLFTNGGNKQTAAMSLTLPNAGDTFPVYIGCINASGTSGTFFDGIIRRIVCGRVARTDTQCVELHNNLIA